MTQADTACAVRRSLDSDPTPGQGQAALLPPGWGSFRSQSKRASEPAHWYAASPLPVEDVQEQYGKRAEGLSHTISAQTWDELVSEAWAQMTLYGELTRGEH